MAMVVEMLHKVQALLFSFLYVAQGQALIDEEDSFDDMSVIDLSDESSESRNSASSLQ